MKFVASLPFRFRIQAAPASMQMHLFLVFDSAMCTFVVTSQKTCTHTQRRHRKKQTQVLEVMLLK